MTTLPATGVRHLTMTGAWAGTYLCGRYRACIGAGSDGTKRPQDSASHFAYTSDAVIAMADTCPDCRHVADCRADDCTRCAAANAS